MNHAAIRHEATQAYCFCLEPGRFLFRLQTGKDDLRYAISGQSGFSEGQYP
ncbi:MAG: alpha amylase N-terminal ig-like domain-containing protein [Oscillospiraceae bacterium]|nr:alpha amylase N-terminal ig-like domain-containing protein [Oscillospiraceae bacterium]